MQRPEYQQLPTCSHPDRPCSHCSNAGAFPLLREWALVMLNAHFLACLVACPSRAMGASAGAGRHRCRAGAGAGTVGWWLWQNQGWEGTTLASPSKLQVQRYLWKKSPRPVSSFTGKPPMKQCWLHPDAGMVPVG